MRLAALTVIAVTSGFVAHPAPSAAAPSAPAAPVVSAKPVAASSGGAGDAAGRAGRLHALLINGGGSKRENYRSHLEHLRRATAWLASAGVPSSRITILASDGDDPAPDLASRGPDGLDGLPTWLLEGTELARSFEDPLTYTSSTLPGHALRPATRAELERTLGDLARRLTTGDTLLLYVTDHGTDDARDPEGNRIVLWGKGEDMTVRRLRVSLGRFAPGVRILTVMSQCFSGAFAELAWRRRGGLPSGDFCGYFSTTWDRPAYGCFPEVAERENLGHAFRLFDALAGGKSLGAAQRELLLGDDAPDVPLRTSDLYLAEQVPGATDDARDRAADRLLAGTPSDEPDKVLARQIAAAFGLPAPMTLVALARTEDELLDALDRLDADDGTWTASLTQATRANFAAFLETHADWRSRTANRAWRALDEGAREKAGRALVEALAAFTALDPKAKADLEALSEARAEVGEVRYRLEVRHAAILRVRALLYRAAGRATLVSAPEGPQARAARALEACESLSLPVSTSVAGALGAGGAGKKEQAASGVSSGAGGSKGQLVGGANSGVDRAASLPPLAEDLARASELRPGFLGLRFRGPSPRESQELDLPRGAAIVEAVQGAPAREAGLRVGDILVGPPDAPFVRPNQLQWWVALAEIGPPLPIVVLRAGRRVTLTLTPIPWPAEPRRKRK